MTSRLVRYSLSRSRALILMTSLFIVCWYPLYTLTLVDPKFEQSTKLYKVLTLVAWSNATLNPLDRASLSTNYRSYSSVR